MSLSHNDIAHNWAHQVKDGQHGGNMLYDGPKIYSYGKHFCIARLLPGGMVAMGTHSESKTTSKHQYLARRAVDHLKTVYCYDPDCNAWRNREYAEAAIKIKLQEAGTPRRVQAKTRLARLAEAEQLAKQFNDYLAALPEVERGKIEPLPIPEVDAEYIEVLKVEAKERAEKDRVAREKEEALRAERERAAGILRASNLSMWRLHNYHGYDLPRGTALRLSKSGLLVETSKGAEIPVTHAKRLWPIIVNCKSVGKGLTDRPIHLGHYTLDEIRPDGSIRVGCHDIPYSEIEAIAKQLGLLEEVESS